MELRNHLANIYMHAWAPDFRRPKFPPHGNVQFLPVQRKFKLYRVPIGGAPRSRPFPTVTQGRRVLIGRILG